MNRPSPVPGFSTPAVGFDQPHEMLKACHERVQRSLDLLHRLVQHIVEKGHDAASRSAAQDVLRYFDIAAPLHHQDEELHLFPLLLRSGRSEQIAAVHRLQSDHVRMHAQWQEIRTFLQEWSALETSAKPSTGQLQAVSEFCAIYPPHIALEESTAYPAAFGLMDDATVHAAAADMRQRRQSDTRRE